MDWTNLAIIGKPGRHGLQILRKAIPLCRLWFSFVLPRQIISWITEAGAILDSASITLSAVDIPYEASGALCIRAGFLALRVSPIF